MSRKAALSAAIALGTAAHQQIAEELSSAVQPDPEKPGMLLNGLPDRLSIRYDSPHFHGGVSSMVGIRIDGALVGNVAEYCISEGWYRLKIGRYETGDRMHSNRIEPFWRTQPSRQVLKRLARGA